MRSTKFKTKTEKGITLIALIITIVVLLILAVVAINSIHNDELISKAEQATNKYNESVNNEANQLQNYLDYLNQYANALGGGDNKLLVADVKNKPQTENKEVYDEYGNKITIPAGFMIRVDDSTNNADDVTEGIVIEDVTAGNAGSQFVWVPVGPIKHLDAEGNLATTPIALGRYVFADGNTDYDNDETKETAGTIVESLSTTSATAELRVTSSSDTYYYVEGEISGVDTAKAKGYARNIENFITSANQKGGYYIGRYEAGDSEATTKQTERAKTTGASTPGTLVCKKDQIVYDYIFQPDASTACRNMYHNGEDGYAEGTFSSDLINSYAWDTAILFIQTFGKDKETVADPAKSVKNYSNLNKSTSYAKTGVIGDEYCNINDMSGNAAEWTTETSSQAGVPCVGRGGYYTTSGSVAYYYTSSRSGGRTIYSDSNYAFRPLLYVGL